MKVQTQKSNNRIQWKGINTERLLDWNFLGMGWTEGNQSALTNFSPNQIMNAQPIIDGVRSNVKNLEKYSLDAAAGPEPCYFRLSRLFHHNRRCRTVPEWEDRRSVLRRQSNSSLTLTPIPRLKSIRSALTLIWTYACFADTAWRPVLKMPSVWTRESWSSPPTPGRAWSWMRKNCSLILPFKNEHWSLTENPKSEVPNPNPNRT